MDARKASLKFPNGNSLALNARWFVFRDDAAKVNFMQTLAYNVIKQGCGKDWKGESTPSINLTVDDFVWTWPALFDQISAWAAGSDVSLVSARGTIDVATIDLVRGGNNKSAARQPATARDEQGSADVGLEIRTALWAAGPFWTDDVKTAAEAVRDCIRDIFAEDDIGCRDDFNVLVETAFVGQRLGADVAALFKKVKAELETDPAVRAAQLASVSGPQASLAILSDSVMAGNGASFLFVSPLPLRLWKCWLL